MMWREHSADLLAGAIVLVLLVLLVNPLDILMLDMGAMMVLSLFALAIIAFAALVWGERARDEREQQQIGAAGRIAYLLGAGILSIGIIVQTIAHQLDIWLVVALGAMVCTKIGAGVYYKINQ